LSGARAATHGPRGTSSNCRRHPSEIPHARPLSDFPGHSCGPDALTGTFEELTNLFILPPGFFTDSAVLALFRMRKTEPDLPRPYRCWGYPGVPALFVAGALALTINIGFERPVRSSIGLLLILAGLPSIAVGIAHSLTRGDVGRDEPKFLVLCRMKS